jgi:hypothetical protein
MMTRFILFSLFFLHQVAAQSQSASKTLHPWAKHGRLMVSKQDPRFLAYADGTPFFWLGDTGWEMIHRLTREEISYYYAKRLEQGFNVIQTVVLAEFDGLKTLNAYGMLPLTDHNPAHLAITPGSSISKQGEYDYWDHVDFAIAEAERQGLYVALLPCWGEYVVPRVGGAIFHSKEEAYAYGNFLGKRYRDKKNIIWILGGDRLPDEIPQGVELWRAMAKGIADGSNGAHDMKAATDYSSTLMTHHCSQSSSKWFQQDEWLDFNMWGSYHDNYNISKAFEQVIADHSLPIIKPTINGEPAYEEHPVNWIPSNGNFTSYDVRQIAYWSVFAGAFGHTYGCNPIWQFYDSGRSTNYFAHIPWKKALDTEGAQQLKYLKRLILSRPSLDRLPANSIITEGEGTGGDHCVATLGKGFAFVYLPTGRPVKVALNKIGDGLIKAWWYNPRNGEATLIGEFKGGELIKFSPPGISKELSWLKTGRGCDWVLVLDDVTKKFSSPGSE